MLKYFYIKSIFSKTVFFTAISVYFAAIVCAYANKFTFQQDDGLINDGWVRLVQPSLPVGTQIDSLSLIDSGDALYVNTQSVGSFLCQGDSCNQLKHNLPQFNNSSHINFIAMTQKSIFSKLIKELPNDVRIFSAQIISDAKKILVGTRSHSAYLYDQGHWQHLSASTQSPSLPKNSWIYTLSSSKNGDKILIGTMNHGAYLWQNNHWQHLTIPTKQPLTKQSWIYASNISKDGSTMVIATHNNGVFLYQNKQWKHLNNPDQSGLLANTLVNSIAMSDDGKTILLGSLFGAYLYQQGRWSHVHKPHHNLNLKTITATYVSPNGKTMLIGTQLGMIYIRQLGLFEKQIN
ncbi:WD40 repeat domain-containing protein [Piscirickettsia litoralis]|uniref:Uncharacterized protein n=1 Tax=Piscirickettsia litoralis TaxID=1891921 RepID=A0ABX3A4W4_9GAMM|nr:hypothetical protein [Piscirickettsia litoralis]ODN43659.1 hypothetical protein BGC07_13030 [Piscirickettsia litoralis]